MQINPLDAGIPEAMGPLGAGLSGARIPQADHMNAELKTKKATGFLGSGGLLEVVQ